MYSPVQGGILICVSRMRIRYILALAAGSAVFLPWVSVFVGANLRGRKVSECPSCHYNRIRPSYPNLFDRVLVYSAVVPYRCENCRRRFYARKP